MALTTLTPFRQQQTVAVPNWPAEEAAPLERQEQSESGTLTVERDLPVAERLPRTTTDEQMGSVFTGQAN